MKTILCVALAVCLGAVVHADAAPDRDASDELPKRIIQLQKPSDEDVTRIVSKVTRTPKLRVTPPEDATVPMNQSRILHGQPVTNITAFPYQVAMISNDGYFCGASLISPRWVLTAAHCISENHVIIVVLVGDVCWAEALAVSYAVRVIVHQDYNPRGHLNDVALLELAGDLNLTNFGGRVLPVDLETEGCNNTYLDDEPAVVTGWGLTSDSSTSLEECLWYVDTKTISNTVCGQNYGPRHYGMICSVNPRGLNGTLCDGDSGGPLVSTRTGRQIGVNSYVSIYGCEAGWPSGYARVPCYVDWIRRAQTL